MCGDSGKTQQEREFVTAHILYLICARRHFMLISLTYT